MILGTAGCLVVRAFAQIFSRPAQENLARRSSRARIPQRVVWSTLIQRIRERIPPVPNPAEDNWSALLFLGGRSNQSEQLDGLGSALRFLATSRHVSLARAATPQVYSMLCVWSVSGQKLAAAPTGETFEDVLHLKRHLRSQHGVPVCLQQLLHAGRCLEDRASLVGPVDLQLVLSVLSPEQMPEAEREFFEYAADTGCVEVGRALLAAGVDKNLQDASETALMRASYKGHVEIVHLLLEAGADKDLQIMSGATALMLASSEGHVKIACLLLEAGADKNLQNMFGETALILASSEGRVEIVRLLLDAGADKNLQNRSGASALMHACSEGHVEIVRLLLEAGANMNLQNRSGATALMHASSEGRVEILRLLLDAGADRNVQEWSGETGLMRASSEGHIEIVRLLLEAGADRNLQDRSGQTALMHASSEGHVEMVDVLEAKLSPSQDSCSPG